MNITTFGLYDFLNHIAVGFMLAYLIVPDFPMDDNWALWVIQCYAGGLIFHKTVEQITNKFIRNKGCMLVEAYNDVEYSKKESVPSTVDIMDKYYRAYYCLMKKNYMGNIPILEAQVAFLRNLWCMLILYFISFFFGIGNARNIVTSSNMEYLQNSVLVLFFLNIILFIIYFFSWENNENKEFSKFLKYMFLITTSAFICGITIHIIDIFPLEWSLHPFTCLCQNCPYQNFICHNCAYNQNEMDIHNIQFCKIGCLFIIGLIPFYGTKRK